MNNYHTLYFLNNHLNQCLKGAVFQKAVSNFKNQIDLHFALESSDPIRLVVNCHPKYVSVFTDQLKPTKSSNVTNFFEDLIQAKVERIYLTENDRIITIAFKCNRRIVLKLFGNRPNVLLLNTDNQLVIDSFKKPAEYVGSEFSYPDKKTLQTDTPDTWDKKSFSSYILNRIPTLDRAYLRYFMQNEIGLENPVHFADQLIGDLTNPNLPFRVLEGSVITTIRSSFLPGFKELNTFLDVNEAIKWCFYNKTSLDRYEQKHSSYVSLFTKTIKSKEASILQLKGGQKSDEKAQLYENIAHSLMAFGQQLNLNEFEDQKHIHIPKMEDPTQFYEVKLDPKLSVIKNAEKYYARARHQREQGVHREKAMDALVEELNSLEKAFSALTDISDPEALRSWEKNYKHLISGSKKEQESRTEEAPFRVLRTSLHDVWVGKNAQSNDDLLRKSHKEDIWLHARGVAGSHVVIRMSNNKGWPDKHFLEAVASVAAYYSKLKGSSLVPVITTKRKFVRKPKNAAAGMAKVDKEDTILARPNKELNW